MSKQFSLLMTDVDLQALDTSLRDWGDVEVLAHVPTEDDRSLQPLPCLAIPISHAGKVPLSSYLAPVSLSKSIVVKRLSPVKISVDIDRSHLIDVRRPYYDGQVVRRGRFYYQNRMLEGGAWIAKDTDFCRWADRVFARVKRILRFDERQDAYLGKDAGERIAAGTVTPPIN